MTIWLVRAGECYPPSVGPRRLRRVEMFVPRLLENGHSVLVWSSTFDHISKRHIFMKDAEYRFSPGYRVRYLHALGYSQNVSFRRLANHYLLGRRFADSARTEPLPDLIYACLPTLEMAKEAAIFAFDRGLPCVIDVRDIWPDVMLSLAPSPFKQLAQLAARPLARLARVALSHATSITAVSDSYLTWALRMAGRSKSDMDAVFPLGYERPFADGDKQHIIDTRMRELGVDPAKTICWFCGFFGPSYDLDTLLAAARILSESGDTGLQFLVTGDGPNRRGLERRSGENVVFTGWAGPGEMAYLMSISKVGLALYRRGATQSMPNKLFEYLSGGLPVVSSLRGESESLLAGERCGTLYEAENPASLVAAIRRLVSDERCRLEFSANALRVYEHRYRSDRIYARMTSHIERVWGQAQQSSAIRLRPGTCVTDE